MKVLGSFGSIAAAGPVGWIVLGIVALACVGILIWWGFYKNKYAYQQSQKTETKQQGDVKEDNQQASDQWDKAEEKVKQQRKKRKPAEPK